MFTFKYLSGSASKLVCSSNNSTFNVSKAGGFLADIYSHWKGLAGAKYLVGKIGSFFSFIKSLVATIQKNVSREGRKSESLPLGRGIK